MSDRFQVGQGDRVIYTPYEWPGVVAELAADRMAIVKFDRGGTGRVWQDNLEPEQT